DEGGMIVTVDRDGSWRRGALIGYPNGLARTGRELIIADTFASRLRTFRIGPGGALAEIGDYAALSADRHPDGLHMTSGGRLWVASFDTGECLLVGRGGGVETAIPFGHRWVTDCAVGGDDGSQLFVATAVTDRQR